jgi:YhcH/YjgK/YiaL family protein
MDKNLTNYDLKWFEKGEWKEGWLAQPDESIDKTEFIKQYALQPEIWQKAFKFLAETDLKTVATGKYEVDGKNLYVNISEYLTKDEADAKCEAHLKYIDIQYTITGEEYMGITPLSETKDATPYSEEKDVYFAQPLSEKYHKADPNRFFIFFPSDAHRPAVKINDSIPVKKALVKIRIAD